LRSRRRTAPMSASCTWISTPARASGPAPGRAASAAPTSRTGRGVPR
jgi:hypothetical protein